jgi:predicted ester cyclase
MTPKHLVDQSKATVQRLVDHIINEWHIEELDTVFTKSMVHRARDDFTSFREAFPDWQMELKEMVAEGDTVVARFICHGTHQGAWRGDEPTGRKMSVDEVFFFRFRDGRINDMWASEDTWTRDGNSDFEDRDPARHMSLRRLRSAYCVDTTSPSRQASRLSPAAPARTRSMARPEGHRASADL